ncbi:histidine phosphatase family protein [Marinobacter sp. SS21]|uniref:histidine phosphatase family protein n=1 Tax=Marinobacter sp. SS21 TaxID=2979460 RepID=UPI00232B9E11|nr:alpha-ribazole phosphatase family protein [Marinobacter sp. SS21]MDC0661220.1 alpha-ribazole phosphatase family protein [Marinobacter sp. SS21]
MSHRATTVLDLIRHGEPRGGPKFRGSQDDPLSELGWQQMRSAISPDDRWDAIVTSPLLRCIEFATELAEQRNLPLHVEDRLREVNFGKWEGKTTDEVIAAEGNRLSRFWEDPVANTPPGGESIVDFHRRVSAGWQHWREQLAGQRVLVVCHGGVIRMILAEVMGVPLQRSFAGIAVPYACRSRIQVDVSSYGTLSCLYRHG